jgi:hypothetical protein
MSISTIHNFLKIQLTYLVFFFFFFFFNIKKRSNFHILKSFLRLQCQFELNAQKNMEYSLKFINFHYLHCATYMYRIKRLESRTTFFSFFCIIFYYKSLFITFHFSLCSFCPSSFIRKLNSSPRTSPIS